MINIQGQNPTRKFISALGAGLAAPMAWIAAAQAADCPRKGTLGTSRILAVNAATTPRVGLKNFSQTLPLAEAARAHELGESGEIGGGKLVLIADG